MGDITPLDLMKFLETFKTSMEEKIEKAKETLEVKIDSRLNTLDKEIDKINAKMDTNDDINKRMDNRLLALEKEMKITSDKVRKY